MVKGGWILRLVIAFAAAFCLALSILSFAAPALAGTTELVSVAIGGTPGNGGSGGGSISADARFVAFYSWATNLVPGDTNEEYDVLVRDRVSGTTERVSVASDGTQSNGASFSSAISDDGRFVAFYSQASNLVPGDTNGQGDVFVRDRLVGTTERVSVADDEAEANWESRLGGISGDGRHVVFDSTATNLVLEDTNGIPGNFYSGHDVFVRDRVGATTERVSVSSSGEQADNGSTSPAISADGRFVVFVSWASNLVPGEDRDPSDIFIHDRDAHTTERLPARPADGAYFGPQISANGEFVGFHYSSDPDVQCGLLLHDRQTGQITQVAADECMWGGVFGLASIAADGRYLAYTHISWYCYFPAPPVGGVPDGGSSAAAELHRRARYICEPYSYSVRLYDRLTGQTIGLVGGSAGDISADGRYVVFSAGPQYEPWQLYIYDRMGDTVPPDTRIASGPCGETVCAGPPTMCWSGSDDTTPTGDLTYLWRVDGGEWQGPTPDTCIALTGLADDWHVFEVKARDAAGNEDPTPAQCSFGVDALGPTIVSIDCVTGPPGFEGLVHITVTASDPGRSITLQPFVSGQPVAGFCSWSGRVTVECHWNLDVTQALLENGAAEICIKAWDSCGNESQRCITVTATRQTFEDVPKTDSIWPYVEALASRGVTAGCSVTPPLYCPYRLVTRAQMAKFVCLAAGKTWLERETPTFADVPKAHPFYGWIERLTDAASWGGTPPAAGCEFIPSRKFCPGGAVTREYLAMVLCLATGKSQMPSYSGIFADVSRANPFSRFIERLADAPSWPAGIAVTNGCASNPPRYCPKDPVTRGQMAVFLVRAFGIVR